MGIEGKAAKAVVYMLEPIQINYWNADGRYLASVILLNHFHIIILIEH